MNRPNIYLSGFMGAGKSTVGRLLARRLNAPFVDTDVAIEEIAGKSVQAIFDGEGEAAFRVLESKILAGIGRKSGLVVSLGGGAVLSAANRDALKRGLWVHLDVPFALLKRRLGKASGRPLAGRGEDALRALWSARMPLYRQARFTVFCGGFSADSVCQKILDALKW
jgi:shikimate kinase